MGYIYLIIQTDNKGNELYKIGLTKKDPILRTKELQTGNPNNISLLKYYETSNYIKLEKLLHKKHSSKKTLANNEWFALSNEDVMDFLKECKKLDTIIDSMKDNYFYN